MGSTLEELAQAGGAHVNLVVSAAGMGAAKVMRERFGIPFVAGVPVGGFREEIAGALHRAVQTGENQYPCANGTGADIVLIGEGITSVSLASALELATGRGTRVLCPVETEGYPLIDIHGLTAENQDWFKTDGVHPDKAGAAAIAQAVYGALTEAQS